MEGDRERFVAMGMTDYVAKPLDRRLLLNKVLAATSRGAPAEVEEAPPAAPPPGSSAQDALADVLSALDNVA
jgi:DNA-binding response OmpR family regulator